jgi:tyrosyl-tRNA synthetase
VKDFHSAGDAVKAGEDWAKQFQKGGVPEDVEEVEIAETSMRIDKLLARVGLADSGADAVRKLKQGSVKVNGTALNDPTSVVNISPYAILQVGRKIKKARPGIPGTGIVTDNLSS